MPIPFGDISSGIPTGGGTQIKLVHETTGAELWLRRAQPTAFDSIYVSSWNASMPEPRESSTELTGQSGTNDDTYLHGASEFVAELKLLSGNYGSHWWVMDEMEEWAAPDARHWVYVARPGGEDWWRAQYRAGPMAFVVGQKGHSIVEASLQLSIPLGVWESVTMNSYSLRPLGSNTVGVTFPITFPVTWDPSNSGGAQEITVGGKRPTPMVVRIYGGQTAPVISDVDTGDQLSFSALGGLSIPLGSYIEIDFQKGTALINGTPGNSVYQYIDFSISNWWLLRPNEVNRLAMTAAASDGSAQATVEFRNRRLRPARG